MLGAHILPVLVRTRYRTAGNVNVPRAEQSHVTRLRSLGLGTYRRRVQVGHAPTTDALPGQPWGPSPTQSLRRSAACLRSSGVRAAAAERTPDSWSGKGTARRRSALREQGKSSPGPGVPSMCSGTADSRACGPQTRKAGGPSLHTVASRRPFRLPPRDPYRAARGGAVGCHAYTGSAGLEPGRGA
jgi:hypothetical protein